MISRAQAALRLVAGTMCAAVLLLGLFTALAALWMAPFLWLAFGRRVVHDPGFRSILFLNILVFWMWAQAVTLGDIKAIASARKTYPLSNWFVEVPRATQLWASGLLDVVESQFVRLRWRLKLFLSLVPGLEYSPEPQSIDRSWRLTVGLSSIAFLSTEELSALAITSALCRFRLVSRPSFFLIGLLRNAERAKSALPPHPGFFSFTRCLLEGTAKILRPLPPQLEAWSIRLAGRTFGEKLVRSALVKSRTAGLLQADYVTFYENSAVKRGLMPPYVEGLWCLYGKAFGIGDDATFKNLSGLWVYERRLLEGFLGRDRVSQLRPTDWDDLHQGVGSSWGESAAEFRLVLGSSRIADLPNLVCEWRSLLRRWLIRKGRVPVVTPDRQWELFTFLLGAALGAVLLQAGWRLASKFGEEVTLAKDSRNLHPFRLISELSSGRLSSAQYDRECIDADIGNLQLGEPAEQLVAAGTRLNDGLHVH